MERNPEWEGEGRPTTRSSSSSTAPRTRSSAPSGWARSTSTSVQPATFERLGEQPDIETMRNASPSYTELAFNMCSEEDCPDAQFNPAVQDKTVRQAIAYSLDLDRITEISSLGTSFPGTEMLPSYYKSFYEVPEQTYPTDVDLANQMLDARLGVEWRRAPDQGRPGALVRPLRAV